MCFVWRPANRTSAAFLARCACNSLNPFSFATAESSGTSDMALNLLLNGATAGPCVYNRVQEASPHTACPSTLFSTPNTPERVAEQPARPRSASSDQSLSACTFVRTRVRLPRRARASRSAVHLTFPGAIRHNRRHWVFCLPPLQSSAPPTRSLPGVGRPSP